jgi:hypothetical protein
MIGITEMVVLSIDTTNDKALANQCKKRTDDMLRWFYARDQTLDTVFPGRQRIPTQGVTLGTKVPWISRDV